MRTRRTGMPTMEFGSDPKKRLTLSAGKRGNVQLAGIAAFSRDGFRHFLQQATWYLDQLESSGQGGPPTPRTKANAPSRVPLSPPTPDAVRGAAGAPSGNW